MSKEQIPKKEAEKESVEEKPKEIRKLTKTEQGEYKLSIENPAARLHITQLFNKEQLKETYNEQLKPQEQGMLSQLSQVKKALKNVEEIESDEEVKKFKEMQSKVAKLEQKEKLSDNLKNIERELDKVRSHKKEIEMAIPELMRQKK